MKFVTTLAVIRALTLALFASAAYSQTPTLIPTILQSHAAVSSGSVTTLANAFSGDNRATNSIVVVEAVGNASSLVPTDTLGNTYSQVTCKASSTTFQVCVYLAVNIKAGANTVTITGTSASMASEIYEADGFIISSTIAATDATNGANATGTALTTGSINPIAPNELVFAGFVVGTAAQTITVTSPFVNDSGQQNSGGTPSGLFSFVSASYYSSTQVPIAAQATITSEPWAAAIASFKTAILSSSGVVVDGCGSTQWTWFPISVSSNTQVIAGAVAKNVYVCALFVAPVAAAANFNLEESATSGNACATSPTGMMGGATAALGAQLSINGGFVLTPSNRAWMKTATAGDAMCIFASAQVTGVLAYVQTF